MHRDLALSSNLHYAKLSKPSSAWAPPLLPLARRHLRLPSGIEINLKLAGHAPTNPAKPNRQESGSPSSALGLELLTLENSSKFGRREWLDGSGQRGLVAEGAV